MEHSVITYQGETTTRSMFDRVRLTKYQTFIGCFCDNWCYQILPIFFYNNTIKFFYVLLDQYITNGVYFAKLYTTQSIKPC